MNHNLLILGAGQYGMVAKETAQAMGCFEKIDFLDDNSELAIGKLQEYERFLAVYSYAFVAIGNAALRLELIGKLEEACYTVAVLVNPKAAIAPSAQLQKGTIVEAMAVVNSNAAVAIGCIISAGAVVNHDSFIGDGCHIDCNATVPSNAILLAGTTVPYGQVYQSEIQKTPKRCPENYSFEVGV
ncbi:MAG: PglB [Oscillospiraceae bacterium]